MREAIFVREVIFVRGNHSVNEVQNDLPVCRIYSSSLYHICERGNRSANDNHA